MSTFDTSQEMNDSDIPKIFYSKKTKKPFKKCNLCGETLLDNEYGYFIEKAFKNIKKTGKKEIIFEYAICTECQQETGSELSKESIKNIEMYFRLYTEEKEQTDNDPKSVKAKISNCFVSEIPVSESSEFQIIGFFIEDRMIIADNLPIALGDKAINEIQELISEKTKDFLDGFKDKVFPPDIREKIPDDKLIFI